MKHDLKPIQDVAAEVAETEMVVDLAAVIEDATDKSSYVISLT